MSPRPAGRPHDPDITAALKQAAEQAIRAGNGRVTVDGLVKQVGTTRPAFYRRYRSIDYLVLDVLSTRFTPGPTQDTGALYTDLLAIQQDRITILADPLVRNSLPTLLEAIRIDPDIRDAYINQFQAPGHARLEAVITRAHARGELPSRHVNTEFIHVLLLGPVLAHALDPFTTGPDQQLAQDTATAITHLLTQ